MERKLGEVVEDIWSKSIEQFINIPSIALTWKSILDCFLFDSYLEYEVDGTTYMRMKFYVSGAKRKGEAILDLKKVLHIEWLTNKIMFH